MPENPMYYLERTDRFFSNNFELFQRRRRAEQAHERLMFETSALTPFASTADFQSKLKAPIVLPIIYGGLILNSALAAAKNIVLLVSHCLVCDFSQADDFLLKAFIDILSGVGFVLAVIDDMIFASFMLVVQVLATVGFNIVSFVSGYDFEAEPYLFDGEEGEDYTQAFLDAQCKDILESLNHEDGLTDYLDSQPAGFLEPFTGNFPLQIKACMVVPVSAAAGCLGMVLGIAKHVSLTAVNLIVLDFDLCYIDLQIAWHDADIGFYLAMSAILDTLYVSTQLVTRTLATLTETLGEWLGNEPSTSLCI